MNKTIKFGLVAAALSVAVPSYAEEEMVPDITDAGAIGWTPVAVSLASPVQLPWGIGEWDVFGLDLGIFYNDICKMYGMQLSLANTTRDDVIGIGFGGFFNYASRDVYGIRAVLGGNICRGTLYGWDVGGFGYHKDVCGLDSELIGCMQDKVCGALVGGIVNFTDNESCGCTLAGGVNLTKIAYGAQVAGVFNQADELHGFQLGLVNYARECPWGFQIGLVNIIMDNKIKVLPIVNAYF